MKVNILKSRIVAAGYNTSSFLDELAKTGVEMCRSAWYRKLNSKTQFTREELEAITKVLNLTADEFQDIFLNI